MIRHIRRALLAGSSVLLLSCDTSQVTAPLAADELALRGDKGGGKGAKPLWCPAQPAASATSIIGPLGGIISAGGATVTVPAGALLSVVTMTVTVPSSNNVEIDVTVTGVEHFVFEQPIAVTMSYAHCAPKETKKPVAAWYFDQVTRALLERMPSVDNPLLRAVTFTTPHLSGYILAN